MGGYTLTSPAVEVRIKRKEEHCDKRLTSCVLLNYFNNRHLAEWRLLHFTVTVMVRPNTWIVNVIGISITSFRR